MKKLIFGSFLSLAMLLASCSKDDEVISDTRFDTPEFTVTAESVVTTDAAIEDVMEAADYEVSLFTGSESSVGSLMAAADNPEDLKSGKMWQRCRDRYRWRKCPDISVDSEEGGFPKTIALDYGDNTELANGRILSGVIQIVISAPLREDGATRTVSYLNFSIDSIGISGTNVKTFMGDRITERVVKVEWDVVFTMPDGLVIECEGEKIKTWVEGLETPFYHGDDVIEITGYAVCEDSEGNVYRKEITDELVKTGACRFIVSGEVALRANGKLFGTVNYGYGSCDNQAKLTTREGEKEFMIGHRVRKWMKNKMR